MLFKNIRTKNALTLRGVYGNIDGSDVRGVYPEKLVWTCEEVKIGCEIDLFSGRKRHQYFFRTRKWLPKRARALRRAALYR